MLDFREARSFVGGALVAAGVLGAAWASDARRRHHRNRRLHRTLVELLLNAITAGDAVTARHSRRVADLTDSLAGALRMGRRERATLRVASLLHDMGKIDDRFFDIIHSRAPLTPEQRAEIKAHPHESSDILAPLEPIHPGITRIVSSHHECWDGSGYPHGWEGERIPLSARIISVADVFDALSQPRAYRDALPPEEVLKKIREGAGTQFDPQIVALLDRPDVWRCWEGIARRGWEEERREQKSGEGGREEASAAPAGHGSRGGDGG
ncbi:MAG TPA: HD domain-containing phosphohydrolase [Longimicrobiaceae bacterium]|nr:HD domain-containing phosphohydrolase [Longimicrobiaceae bacterium]